MGGALAQNNITIPRNMRVSFGGIMENINFGIACDVNMCKYNHDGCNCTLDKIQVGTTCEGKECTCCKSYIER